MKSHKLLGNACLSGKNLRDVDEMIRGSLSRTVCLWILDPTFCGLNQHEVNPSFTRRRASEADFGFSGLVLNVNDIYIYNYIYIINMYIYMIMYIYIIIYVCQNYVKHIII